MNVFATASVHFDANKVSKAADQATIRALYKQAAYIMKVARGSIKKGTKQRFGGREGDASPPGTPPHTTTNRLPNAIRFEVDKTRQMAIIGPDSRYIGEVGGAHEFGGPYKSQQYPARPFMRPALEKSRPSFENLYRDSIR